MRKLFAFDIDGTLLSDYNKVLESSIEAIKKIKDNGDIAIICSGRPVETCLPIAKQAGITEIIANNGATYFDINKGKKEFIKTIPFGLVKDVFEIFTENEAFAFRIVNEDSYSFYNVVNRNVFNWFESHFGKQNIFEFKMFEKEQFLNHLKNKNNFLFAMIEPANKHEIDAVVRKFEILKKNDPSFSNVYLSEIGNYELHMQSKWDGIINYCNKFNINPENIYTFGDGLNDMEMISNSKHGVAMGNAVPELKQVASFVTDTNNKDGIKKYIDSIYA